jgi:hypothetical protein
MIKNFLVALVIMLAYIGLQYDFSKKIKKQKKVFIMGVIIFFIVFIGCMICMPKKKGVKFNNDVQLKTFDKTASLTDGDGYHDEGSGSSDGSYDGGEGDGGGGGGGFENDFHQQSQSQSSQQSSPDGYQPRPVLTSGPPPMSLPSLTSSIPTTMTPSSSADSFSVPAASVPFPM